MQPSANAPGRSWYAQMAANPANWTTGELKRALESGDRRPEVLRAAANHQSLARLARDTVSPEVFEEVLNGQDRQSEDEILAALGFGGAS